MALFFILAPFAIFAALMVLSSAKIALAAAAAAGLALTAWDLVRGRSVKMLTAGAMTVFVALLAYHALVDNDLTPTAIRVAADSGVLAIALISLAIGTPFTLQYARETVDAETQAKPLFLRTNYILTWVWTASFVAMLAADLVAIYLPSVPLWTCLAIAFVARNGATYFTRWYPQRALAGVEASDHALHTAA